MDFLLALLFIGLSVWVSSILITRWYDKSNNYYWTHEFYQFLIEEEAFDYYEESKIIDYDINKYRHTDFIKKGVDYCHYYYWNLMDKKWQQRIEEIESRD